jgi:eukaryotic-like serine/threonine-protein kinase
VSRHAPLRPRIGRKLRGDLTILAKVDERSSDPVYVVWNHQAWCPMACKMFGSARRARREARALSTLSHPNIVRCFGFFEPTHMLMEFLEGPTLSSLIARQPGGRLSISDAIRVAMHIGAALEHVHRRGFLHLDVKPANVIVVHGRPVLFDFGSMRVKGAPRPPYMAGTDPYIAPEECREEAQVTEAADVFSLGVTLYEMLAGTRPFADRRSGRPFPQLKRAPVPLRRRRPAVPAGLEAIILRCLARDPADRPRLADLLPALHAFISTGPSMWPSTFDPARPTRRLPATASRGRQPMRHPRQRPARRLGRFQAV